MSAGIALLYIHAAVVMVAAEETRRKGFRTQRIKPIFAAVDIEHLTIDLVAAKRALLARGLRGSTGTASGHGATHRGGEIWPTEGGRERRV
jgi:hypothetical protein